MPLYLKDEIWFWLDSACSAPGGTAGSVCPMHVAEVLPGQDSQQESLVQALLAKFPFPKGCNYVRSNYCADLASCLCEHRSSSWMDLHFSLVVVLF